MQTDLFSATGSKLKAITLPASLFEAPVNEGLMHQALVRQQSNRRRSTAHTKSRGEVMGSTKKLFAQKHTGRARRGPVRAAGMRGGGKAFGSQKDRNYEKDMPQKMRHAALRSCLSAQAKKAGTVLVLENYPDTIKTKSLVALLGKLPVEQGRRILLVTAASHAGLRLSARNVTGVKTVSASYLNPEDVLGSRYLIFLEEAITAAEKLFGTSEQPKVTKTTKTSKTTKKTTTKKPSVKKATAKTPKSESLTPNP
jgi:large subunit ribosomal protein L4